MNPFSAMAKVKGTLTIQRTRGGGRGGGRSLLRKKDEETPIPENGGQEGENNRGGEIKRDLLLTPTGGKGERAGTSSFEKKKSKSSEGGKEIHPGLNAKERTLRFFSSKEKENLLACRGDGGKEKGGRKVILPLDSAEREGVPPASGRDQNLTTRAQGVSHPPQPKRKGGEACWRLLGTPKKKKKRRTDLP